MGSYIGAIDQGTTSTRFMIFDEEGREVARHQLEHAQIMPQPGWVEHDAREILRNTEAAIAGAMARAGLRASDLAAIGVTNQRETTVAWYPRTGEPCGNAIVWQDTRTEELIRAHRERGEEERVRERTGLPLSTYFAAGKMEWMLTEHPELRRAAARGAAVFGTIDSWVIWNLTGGADGGAHVTDPSNASRTLLMDLRAGAWDPELADLFGVPMEMLPAIRPSSDPQAYGLTRAGGPLGGEAPVCGALGDQQAATMGQVCFDPGEGKNTYGTGNFLLVNTGTERIRSTAGLLTTALYRLGAGGLTYALEGPIAVTGSAVQWLRDQLGVIRDAGEIEALAASVPDAGGIYFVPAFSGLFAPHWRPDARGAIVGLSRFHTRAHLARATLEAICYQTRDIVEAMVRDSGRPLEVLRVDGGASVNNLLMQMQADILGTPVVRPKVTETTALGAAYAAGLAAGAWRGLADLRRHWQADAEWMPRWSADQREAGYAGWRRALKRTLGWSTSQENPE